MNMLTILIALFSTTPVIGNRPISECSMGGIYLNNSIELAMCWGDDLQTSAWNMERQGFVRTYDFPNTPDAQFYQGGVVFGSDIALTRLLFNGDSLVEIYVIFQNIGSVVSYRTLSQTYDEFKDYFMYDMNGYEVLRDIPSYRVFPGQFSDCTGECGMVEYAGEYIDIEVKMFIEGKAKQEAIFIDSLAMAGIRIEVPHWTLQHTSGARLFTMEIPYFTLCFSEPRGSIARTMDKIKRRM